MISQGRVRYHKTVKVPFDIDQPQTYHVHYPSGKAFVVADAVYSLACFKGYCRAPLLKLPRKDGGHDAMVLDPRAVIGRVCLAEGFSQPTLFMIYHPLHNDAQLPKDLLDWMANHPEWPGSLISEMAEVA